MRSRVEVKPGGPGGFKFQISSHDNDSSRDRNTSMAAATTISPLMACIHRKSIGHWRQKQGEQGACALSRRCCGSPGKPGDPQHRLLNAQAPCSPCFWRQCPIDFRCMHAISGEMVVAAAMEVLRSREESLS